MQFSFYSQVRRAENKGDLIFSPRFSKFLGVTVSTNLECTGWSSFDELVCVVTTSFRFTCFLDVKASFAPIFKLPQLFSTMLREFGCMPVWF